MSPDTPLSAPARVSDEVPVVASFAVATHPSKTVLGATGRLSVALPAETTLTPATLVPALLNLGQQILLDYRLTGRELPEVEVTTLERADTVPAATQATGFTVGVTNDLQARRSAFGVDSGLLLTTATLFAGAEHLLKPQDSPADRYTPT